MTHWLSDKGNVSYKVGGKLTLKYSLGDQEVKLLNTSKNIAEVFKINNIRMSFEKKKDCSKEANLLFVLLAERYEQRSLVITSNLVFSKWNQIFQDEMTTTAAIDRLVHHATIIELNTESYRMKAAKVAKNHSHETTKKMEESNVK